MYTLMGYDPVSFMDPQSGEMVEGTRFHLVADPASSTVKNGVDVMAVFFNKSKIVGSPCLGASCDLKFSVRNGKAVMTGIEIKSKG